MFLRFEETSTKITVYFTSSRILDEQTIMELGSNLLEACQRAAEAKKRLVLNFRDVSYMSSAMLGKLILVNKRCTQSDVNLMLCEIAPDILEVFKVMKLNRILRIRRTDDGEDGPELLGSPVPSPLKPSEDSSHAEPNSE